MEQQNFEIWSFRILKGDGGYKQFTSSIVTSQLQSLDPLSQDILLQAKQQRP